MRILIVKTSSMGDVVHALPAISDICAPAPGRVHRLAGRIALCRDPALHPGVATVWPMAWRKWRKRLLARATWAAMGASARATARASPTTGARSAGPGEERGLGSPGARSAGRLRPPQRAGTAGACGSTSAVAAVPVGAACDRTLPPPGRGASGLYAADLGARASAWLDAAAGSCAARPALRGVIPAPAGRRSSGPRRAGSRWASGCASEGPVAGGASGAPRRAGARRAYRRPAARAKCRRFSRCDDVGSPCWCKPERRSAWTPASATWRRRSGGRRSASTAITSRPGRSLSARAVWPASAARVRCHRLLTCWRSSKGSARCPERRPRPISPRR